jgi:acyl-CoA synthetase (AMP-forming)/AMP-acid ligase II
VKFLIDRVIFLEVFARNACFAAAMDLLKLVTVGGRHAGGGQRGRHTNYKVPKQVIVVNALPRNTMGKVLKNELRASLANSSK